LCAEQTNKQIHIHTMKNKITCLLAGAALFGATANAEIALGESLSASGYIDIVAVDGDAVGGNKEMTTTEFELGLSFTPAESAFSAVAELSFGEADVEWETVTITYQHSDALSFTFGNILSYQGLESYDAPNNYFVSYAGKDNSALYSAGYATGISADYSTGDFALGVWAGDSVAGDSLDLEYYIGYTGIENLTLAVALADNNEGGETTNFMVTYEYDAFTLMAETVESEDFAVGSNLDVTAITAAYAMGDTTYAIRLADGDYEGVDYEKLSVSAFHAFSDNVSAGVEFLDEEQGSMSGDSIAFELLYVY